MPTLTKLTQIKQIIFGYRLYPFILDQLWQNLRLNGLHVYVIVGLVECRHGWPYYFFEQETLFLLPITDWWQVSL